MLTLVGINTCARYRSAFSTKRFLARLTSDIGTDNTVKFASNPWCLLPVDGHNFIVYRLFAAENRQRQITPLNLQLHHIKYCIH
jgi:hypothetical protein